MDRFGRHKVFSEFCRVLCRETSGSQTPRAAASRKRTAFYHSWHGIKGQNPFLASLTVYEQNKSLPASVNISGPGSFCKPVIRKTGDIRESLTPVRDLAGSCLLTCDLSSSESGSIVYFVPFIVISAVVNFGLFSQFKTDRRIYSKSDIKVCFLLRFSEPSELTVGCPASFRIKNCSAVTDAISPKSRRSFRDCGIPSSTVRMIRVHAPSLRSQNRV